MTSPRRPGPLRGAAVTVVLGGALLAPAARAIADDLPAPAAASFAAEDVGTARDRTTLLVAAGGVAVTGAAGLGFAMLRRGRTDAGG
ncbi:hypothetical protein ACFPM3_27245 [Streptomyces coeruleoprunus]|uniref:Uncharacterized protein n=1 Tax=Streptomyces coeruleoprunus TaxID=285563 RepID=A0ABV9XMW2_9ACTN